MSNRLLPTSGFRRICAFGLMALLSPVAMAAPTDEDIFTYATARYPELFNGAASTGNYQNYHYRYFAGTGNYLAVNAGTIYILGPSLTGGKIASAGTVAAYAPAIEAWKTQSCQSSTAGTYNGTATGGHNGSINLVLTAQAGSSSIYDTNGSISMGGYVTPVKGSSQPPALYAQLRCQSYYTSEIVACGSATGTIDNGSITGTWSGADGTSGSFFLMKDCP